MIDQVRREVQRALAGVRGAVRAVQQGLQIATRIQRANAEALQGETLQDMEVMQEFGFTSAPPDGAQLIVLPLGGRTSAAVVIATEHGAYRFKLNNKGEAAIYNQWGDRVHLRQDRSVEVVADLKVRLQTPLVECTQDLHVFGNATVDGNVDVGGTVTATVDVIGGGKHLKTHSHSGVVPGGGTSGGPS